MLGADGVGDVALCRAVKREGVGNAFAFGYGVCAGVQAGNGSAVANRCARRAVELLGVAFVVLVCDANADGFANVGGCERVAVAGCARNGLAVRVPLVFAAALCFAVLVVEPGLQGVADAVAAGDAKVAGVVVIAAVVGVGVAHLYGEVAAGGGAVAVGSGNGHHHPFFVGVIERDAVFQF